MGAESWAAFALALLVALAVPGPDLVLVVHAATRGVREGASTAVGIVAGLMLHALLAAAGATALLVSAPGALTIVQLIGAGVLLWMGTSMLRAAPSAEPDATEDIGHRTQGGYARGFVTNATNPKALLFFAAFLPQFIDPARSLVLQFAIMAGSFAVVEVATEALIAGFAQRISPWLGRVGRRFNQVCGGLFMAIGVALPLRP